MGRNEWKQESLTTGRLFSPYYIYRAGKAKVAVADMSTPPALFGEAQKPSPILRDGLGMGSGRKDAREEAYFSCKPGNRTTALE